KRPITNMAAGGATVAGRRHQDYIRPATGLTTHRRSNSRYINSYQNFNSTSLVWGQKHVEHAVSWTGFDRVRRQEPVWHSVNNAVRQVLTELIDKILSGPL
ncbi:hypothetical protein ACLOJK_034771, partial [Asimina triloba]